MLIFKLNVRSLLIFLFSLASFSTIHAETVLPVKNELAASAPMSQSVQITNPSSSNILHLVNMPVTISAVACNTAGDLASIVLLVNGQAIAFDNTATLTSTYTPTVAGRYTIEAIATYTDDTQVSTQVRFNVRSFTFQQFILPVRG